MQGIKYRHFSIYYLTGLRRRRRRRGPLFIQTSKLLNTNSRNQTVCAKRCICKKSFFYIKKDQCMQMHKVSIFIFYPSRLTSSLVHHTCSMVCIDKVFFCLLVVPFPMTPYVHLLVSWSVGPSEGRSVGRSVIVS